MMNHTFLFSATCVDLQVILDMIISYSNASSSTSQAVYSILKHRPRQSEASLTAMNREPHLDFPRLFSFP